MIGKSAEEVLNRAVRFAFDRDQEYFTLEHVLLSLLEEPSILEIIQESNVSYTDIKSELEQYIENSLTEIKRKESGYDDSDEAGDHPVATLSVQRMIQRALIHVQSAGKREILPKDLFIALFQAKDSFALHCLKKRGIERLDVLEFVSHGSDEPEIDALDEGDIGNGSTKRFEAIEAYTVNLNQMAREGNIDPLIGRALELDRVIRILGRRRKNNPLLVGEAGVGKTAIAEGLALKIVERTVPQFLLNAEVYSLDMGSILAGSKFRGDFEQRLKKVIKELKDKKSKGILPILLVDEIHVIVGAGSVSGGSMDAANLLKPVLTRGDVRCIGSTTYQEYRTVFDKDQALSRRFQKVDIEEPSSDETIRILKGLRKKFEDYHHVEYSDESIKAAVDLSIRHITDRHLPDKAIDVIDEVGSEVRIRNDGEKSLITEADVEEVVAKLARIPARSVSANQRKRLKSLEADLKLTIYGQDSAISKVVGAIRLARSGLRSGDRPIGSFLFSGPTGVGKTELSKQLASSMGLPLLRFDMSEYMEKHSVSRLIGAPPGYVGFDQSGLLTEEIVKHPHSVLLLDEIEKAHVDVLNILLQVMDHGALTDNNGRKADFRNVILIMTSNVGSRELNRSQVGLSNPIDESESRSKTEIERFFTPEFRNRLDSIVYFNPLNQDTIGQVVNKHLMELESQLMQSAVEIEVSQPVKNWIIKHGYDVKLGARPMARLIENEIKKPLADEILFGQLVGGGKVRVTVRGQKIVFTYTRNKKRSKSKKKETVG